MKTRTKTEPKTDIEVKLEAIEKRMDRFQEKVRAYDPSNMFLMEQRHKELSERMQLLIQKITVITEVGHHTRNTKGLSESQRAAILDAAVRAFDQDDDWWKRYDWNRYDTLTVKQWAKMFLDTH